MGELIRYPIDKRLLASGFDKLSLEEKNQLIEHIGTQDQVLYSQITEAYILDYHKKIKKIVLSNQCEEAIVGGFTSLVTGYKYRTNRDDQLNMVGKYIKVMDDTSITQVAWKTEDVGYHIHSRADFLAVYDEAFNHKENTIFKLKDLRDQVDAAITHDEIVAIVW